MKIPSLYPTIIASLSVFAASMLLTQRASAQTIETWTGTTSTSYGVATNWTSASGGIAPVASTTVVFGASVTATQPLVIPGNSTAGGFVFLSSTGGWTLGTGSSGDMNGTFTVNDLAQTSGTDTINGSILRLHNGNITLQVGGGGTLLMNAALATADGATARNYIQSGAGTIQYMTAATNGVFGYNFNGGNIIVGASDVFGLSGHTPGVITWNNNTGTMSALGSSTFQIDNALTVSSTATFGGSGNLNFNSSVTLSGSQAVVLTGGGTVGWKNGVGISGALGALTVTGNGAGGALSLQSTNGFTSLNVGAGANVIASGTGSLGTGTVTVSGGTLSNQSNANLTYANALVITNSMALAGTGTNGMTFSGSVSLNAVSANNTVTINNANNNPATFSGVIYDGGSGAGSVVLGGPGTIVFGGVNTYSGSTVVNVGTLLVTGSLGTATAVTVAGGATLGVGKSAGAASFGTLNVASMTLTGTATSILSSTIKLTLGNGGLSDEYVTSGSISITGGGIINLVLNADSGVSALTGSYTLLTWNAGTNDVLPSQVNLIGDTVINNAVTAGYRLQDSGNSLVFSTGAVPEPSTWALFGCSLAVLGWAGKKRGRRTAFGNLSAPRR